MVPAPPRCSSASTSCRRRPNRSRAACCNAGYGQLAERPERDVPALDVGRWSCLLFRPECPEHLQLRCRLHVVGIEF